MKKVIVVTLLLATCLFAQMSQRVGEPADTLIVGNNGFVISPTGLVTSATAIPIASGGTAAITAALARASLGVLGLTALRDSISTNFMGDGLSWKLTSGGVMVNADYNGGIETTDDSLNIKLNGAELELAVAGLSIASAMTRDEEWNTEAEVQTVWGSVNILLETEIDGSLELAGLLDNETGTGDPVFNTAPSFASTISIGTNTGTSGEIDFVASDNDQGAMAITTADALSITGFNGGILSYNNIDPGAADTYSLGAGAAFNSAYISDNLCVGGKSQTASIYASQEAVFANTDSSIKVWVNAGVPTISGAATDGDLSNLTWNTSDQVVLTGADFVVATGEKFLTGAVQWTAAGTDSLTGIVLAARTVPDLALQTTVTLDAKWNTQAEVETIWGVTLATDTELADYLAKTAFDDSLNNNHIVTGKWKYRDSLRVETVSSNTNSPASWLVANNAGAEVRSSLQMMYGADPYLRLAVADTGAGTIAVSPVLDIKDDGIFAVIDNKVDIGGVSDNRPRNLNLAGNANLAGGLSFDAGIQATAIDTVCSATGVVKWVTFTVAGTTFAAVPIADTTTVRNP